jgi:hypothetical protein
LPKANRVNLVTKIGIAAANLLRLQNQPLQEEEDEGSAPIEVNLDDLASTIRTAHEGVTLAAANMIEFALTAGDALLRAKETVGHGKWLPWLKTECDLSERTAHRYMAIANARAVIEANPTRATDLGLTAVLKLISAEKRIPKKTADKPKPAKAADQPRLDPLAWSCATPKERTAFLDAAGKSAVLAAAPPAWALDDMLLGKIRRRSDETGPVIDLMADEIPPFLQRAA